VASLLLVSGSPASPSGSTNLVTTVAAQVRLLGHVASVLSLRDLPCAPLVGGDHRHPALRASAAALDRADGLVVAAPVYKSSLPGLLKCWFDVLPRHGLLGKDVLPLATARFADDLPRYALSLGLVLGSMGARTVHAVVGVVDGADGVAPATRHECLHDSVTPRIAEAVETFCTRLSFDHAGSDVPRPANPASTAALVR
jgi:FMN reductase